MTETEGEKYVVELSDDQWRIVVGCLKYVRAVADFHPQGSIAPIDKLCRSIIREQIGEILKEIASNISFIEAE